MKRRLSVVRHKYQASSAGQLKKELEASGLSTFEWSDKPGAFYSPHSHANDEIIVVSSGKIVFIVDGIEHELGPGDELVLPAHTTHSAENRSSTAVSYFICTDR